MRHYATVSKHNKNEVTKPLNSVSNVFDAGDVVVFTSQGCTVRKLWTHTLRESGVYVLSTVRRGTPGIFDFSRLAMCP